MPVVEIGRASGGVVPDLVPLNGCLSHRREGFGFFRRLQFEPVCQSGPYLVQARRDGGRDEVVRRAAHDVQGRFIRFMSGGNRRDALVELLRPIALIHITTICGGRRGAHPNLSLGGWP